MTCKFAKSCKPCGHSGTTARQFQPSCDVTTYTVDPSAVASRCLDSRASGGTLMLRMRSQTRVTKPKAWTLRVSLKSSLDRVAHKRKKHLGVFCWGGVVAVVVSLVLVLSSLWSGFPCCGWVSFSLAPFISKERAATQEPTNFSSRIQLIGTVQRTGTLFQVSPTAAASLHGKVLTEGLLMTRSRTS